MHPYSKKFAADGKPFGVNQLPPQKLKVIDASQLFKLPHRSTRPDHIVVILRGLPGISFLFAPDYLEFNRKPGFLI